MNARRLCIATRITSAKKVMYAIFVYYYGTSNPGLYTQRQVNECKVLQEKSSKKTCQIVPKRQSKTGICVIYLSHDNALCHKAGSMTSFLNEPG